MADTGPMADEDVWDSIDRLHAWLDANRAHGGREGLLLRMLKLSEEVGEVAQAVIGATGQNPRKGTSHRCYLGSSAYTCRSELVMAVSHVRHVCSWRPEAITARSCLGPAGSSTCE
ncbi:MazG-like family protein [Streptomyces sp. R41]|uniref:MazG-like family protein n=1 Tax=Streptomyces sp. R41 TaxID=3238632 RepID=A0AB39RDL5_9ACTN